MTQRFGPAVGPWHSSHPSRAVVWLASVHVPWWVAGGWALDLFLGRQTRPHKDLDVGILRKNAPRNVREWTLELLLDDSADDQWVFRRDPKVRIPLAGAIRHTVEGIPSRTLPRRWTAMRCAGCNGDF
jgi:hypothetical protein